MSEETETGDQVEAAAPLDNAVQESEVAHQKEHSVPLDALQDERSKRQRLEDENRMYREYMELLKAQQQQPAPKQNEEFDGMSDDDVLTVGEFKRALAKKEQQYETSISEMRMMQKYPDYADVVTKYLPEVIKHNPGIGKTLQSTQDYELAYILAKNSDAYRNQVSSTKRSAEAERIVKNSKRAGDLASVGHTSPINQAKRWKDMPDEEFQRHVHQNLGY